MDRVTARLHQPRATSVASEWAKTFLVQSLIGVVLAVVWTMLGLQ